MMACAEGLASSDFDGDVMRLHLIAVVGAMHQEATGTNRLQAFERLRDPVDIRDHLAVYLQIRVLFCKQLLYPGQNLFFLICHQID